MSKLKISVERIHLNNLVAFAEKAENDPHHYGALPITQVRAAAQEKNPSASPDDISLIVAYHENKCIGYLGILPCQLECHGDLQKIYALTTFYVVEEYRKTCAALAIMQDAIALNYDFLLAGFTPSAERFYRRHDEWFDYIGVLPYNRIHLYPTVSLLWMLKERLPFLSIITNALQILNSLAGSLGFRFLTYYMIRPSQRNRCADLDFRKIERIEEVAGVAQRSKSENRPKFYRGESIINWMIQHPWINERSGEPSSYEFSHYRDLFRFLAYEIFNNATEKQVGYMILSVSRKNELTVMKILDFEFEDDVHLECILNLTLREAYRWKVDIIDGPADFWGIINSHKLLKLIAQRKQRGYFIHRSSNSAFSDDPQDLILNFCDGDTAFT
ncbi:hypothetical protein CEE37_13245 [candidate division LCP-89 bacterium B3_LCP]|uniref:N-acetyltransferase domain-containing protein n=1 Tax=candidate division LCP-89 bacterium B3_LCP TaxID=2012998 RepID=A0A532USK8_UNCL8|nr:MAG: hypothetical protein CEE37_13245 [candidate division LCP-89 bacterium B3_LCP]